MTRLVLASCLVALALLAGCATVPQGIPRSLLDACLDLPEATAPTTNGELLDGFLTAREGHAVCRATAEALGELYGD